MKKRGAVTLVAVVAVLAALVIPASAAAQTSTFYNLEAEATANYLATVRCDDGTTVQQRVTVIAGHEESAQNGETTFENDFVTIRVRGFDCEGNFVNDFATGPAEFTYSPSLQAASVEGTVTSTRTGSTYTVDITWEGRGPLKVTNNQTNFPGFTGHFTGKRRDAVATGTVVVNGTTLVNGSTTNAQIETLEDRNVSTSSDS
jgi:hypothetical protein